MHILGLANGVSQGNSEILLKAALTAAVEFDPSITTSWIHVPSVSIPRNPPPMAGTMDSSLGTVDTMQVGPSRDRIPDDRRAVLDAILDADAIVIATPTYSHQPAGTLKLLFDRIGGPFLDASFAELVVRGQAAGDPKFKDATFDPRLRKPRVVGFIAIGGSKTVDQFTMTLPTLHTLVFPFHGKVVDQFFGRHVGARGAVLLQPELVERAYQLGRNVASQLGKQFDDAQYLGPKEPAGCPNCHLSKLELLYTGDNIVGCVTCGTRGRLTVHSDGRIYPAWEQDSVWSCITMRGKLKHAEDVMQWGAETKPKLHTVQKEKDAWLNLYIPAVSLPSTRGDGRL